MVIVPAEVDAKNRAAYHKAAESARRAAFRVLEQVASEGDIDTDAILCLVADRLNADVLHSRERTARLEAAEGGFADWTPEDRTDAARRERDRSERIGGTIITVETAKHEYRAAKLVAYKRMEAANARAAAAIAEREAAEAAAGRITGRVWVGETASTCMTERA